MKKILFIALLFLIAPLFAHGGINDEIDVHSTSSAVSATHLYHYLVAFVLAGTGLFGYYLYDKYKPKLK